MFQLICPNCGRPMAEEPRLYRCPAGHCFDRAKSGYVNLLPPAPGGKRHGDDKLMVKARTDFLNKGFYDPLANALARLCDEHSGDEVDMVDAGCGEGKYTANIAAHLAGQGKAVSVVGIDISKEALIQAARRPVDMTLCVASTAHIPLADGCADLVLNIFSPFMPGEFARVLREGGRLIRVVPLERHLFELKALIYETPYENPPMDMTAPGFTLLEEHRVEYPFTLNRGEDIMALFMMTPYYYKTGAADQAKAAAATHLDTIAQFGIYIYEKL